MSLVNVKVITVARAIGEALDLVGECKLDAEEDHDPHLNHDINDSVRDQIYQIPRDDKA